MLWRRDWETRIRHYIDSWGTKDRWGDYELLLGAARANLRVREIPVHYQERIYGSTKMTNVFINGVTMLRLWLGGFLRLRMRWMLNKRST